MTLLRICLIVLMLGCMQNIGMAEDFQLPFSSPCTQRQDFFAFSQKPSVTYLGNDRHAIEFTVKGYCDVTVAVLDKKGVVIRHLGSGVLGANAPKPFQQNTLKQRIFWDGKDDLGRYPKSVKSLQVRVSLGLKPTFDKRLGPTHPKNMPGGVWSLAADASGVYAMSMGVTGRVYIRKFSHDAKYLKTLTPPPAKLSAEKMKGLGVVRYASGQQAVQAPGVNVTVSTEGSYLAKYDRLPVDLQPIVVDGKIYYVNSPRVPRMPSKLYYIRTDGSTDVTGQGGWPWGNWLQKDGQFRLAASPDHQWCYLVGNGDALFRRSLTENKPVQAWIGNARKPGSDQRHFNQPTGVDVDADGNVYVADQKNNRIQIYSGEGKYLQTIPVMLPSLIRIHLKTGALYVIHQVRIKGKAVGRLTKFASRKDPTVRCTLDGLFPLVMVVDSWSDQPRIWVGGNGSVRAKKRLDYLELGDWSSSFTIWEEDGKSFKKVGDFLEDARKAEPEFPRFRWNGSYGKRNKFVCDPLREQAYYLDTHRFDLTTGAYLGTVENKADDIAFDKKGYMHCHFRPGSASSGSFKGVGRLNPSMATPKRDLRGKKVNREMIFSEVPYDYGAVKKQSKRVQWLGVMPTQCQPGAKHFQDGIGVNMRGDVAVQSNIYHIPRMGETGFNLAAEGLLARRKSGIYVGGNNGGAANNYASYIQSIQKMEKRGESVYFIRRKPGIPLGGGTIWTFEQTGELRQECAVIAGDLLNGVQIDEDGDLYFVNARTKMYPDRRYFLQDKGGLLGKAKSRVQPFTGSLIKTAGQGSTFLLANAKLPLETLPQRPPELIGIQWPGSTSKKEWCWVEGAQWIYGGASPIVSVDCSCPTMRHATDWFKRSFVPEAYRHSIGVLDAAGNLIMHIGQYGNWDSGKGPKSLIDVGGDHIGITFNEMVSATDNYLVFDDHGEKLVVLKLEYHVEETISIK